MKSNTRGLRYFSRLTVIIAIAVLGFSLPGYGDSYSLISDQPVNAPLSAQGTELPAGFPSAWRSRAVALNPVITSSDVLVPGDVITLNLFADTVLTAQVDRVSENVNGTVTVRGRIEDYPLGYLIISTTNNNSLASIQIPETGERYRIQMDTLTGIHYLLEENTDQLDELEDGPTLIPPTTPQNMEMLADNVAGDPLDPVNLDVMVVYTPAARQWADSSGGGIANVIAQAVAKGQLALDNSNTVMTISLVYFAEVSYTESGSSSTDLSRLTNTSDGYMDEVHTLRNQYYADVVGLFTKIEDTGGIGYLLSSTSGQPAYAFSISRVQQAATGYTYIHEMGHNMGCHHRKDQVTQPGPGLFSYSAGWHWTGNNSGKYCSVMSYEDGGYSTVAYFSNPSILYQGVPTGHAADGDNARTLREIKNVIAAYRQPTQTGSLSVTINPQGAIDAGAQWRRTGTSTWRNSGYTESGIPIGQYTVEFSSISGWNTPANQIVQINNGQTTYASGTYTVINYTLTVNSSGAPSVSITSSTGHGGTTNYAHTVTSGTTVSLTAPSTSGGKSFTGWTGNVTSSNQTISFSMNSAKTVTATYAQLINIGSGPSSWDFPLYTYYHDARTQTIYLASEIGGAYTFNSLALDVTTIPGQLMSNFTIRFKETALAAYGTSPVWESTGWTTVYQSNQTISTTGWTTFNFTTPFSYNGTQNLMIDICFNNSSWTFSGQCRYTSLGSNRSLTYYTDSGYGDPLTWTNSSPIPNVTTFFPNIRLGYADIPVPPAATPVFTPDGGSYSSKQIVTITCATPGATIHYTTDGNDPTESDPIIASGSSVLVSRTLTLKARAWKEGIEPSEIKTADYQMDLVCPAADLTGDCIVNLKDFASLANWWLDDCNASNDWCDGADFDLSGDVSMEDMTELAAQWLTGGIPDLDGMVWESINDPGVSGHEGFNGQMSKYETTNAQYRRFLNAVLASGDITVNGNNVIGANARKN